MDKLDIAEEQLITAINLFFADESPVSVHTLAGAAREIIDKLGEESGADAFVLHAMRAVPNLTRKEYFALANKFRNSFKHADRPLAKEPKGFQDDHNDALLFVASFGLLRMGRQPVEAQVYEPWYLVQHTEKLADFHILPTLEHLFPGIRALNREDQKAMGAVAIRTLRG